MRASRQVDPFSHAVRDGQLTFGLVSDGKMKKDDVSRAKQLGTIVIKCAHKVCHARTTRTALDKTEGLGIVTEKAVKGQKLSHNVE